MLQYVLLRHVAKHAHGTSMAMEKLLCLGFHFRIAQSNNADEYINLLNYSKMKDRVQ